MPIAPIGSCDSFHDDDDDDDEGWQEMELVRDTEARGRAGSKNAMGNLIDSKNAMGNLIDFDAGYEWRTKLDDSQNESKYTRLRGHEEDELDEVDMRTKYLFNGQGHDSAQPDASEEEPSRRAPAHRLRRPLREEQKMIQTLAIPGVPDLVPALVPTHTVANPEYDPAEARRKAAEEGILFDVPPTPTVSTPIPTPPQSRRIDHALRSGRDRHIADNTYDAHSRVLLERAALKSDLGWTDVVRSESRVTEAEIPEEVNKMEQQESSTGDARKKHYMMLGLATLGGGLVIRLSAGQLAPVIGAGLGAALGTVGIIGTTAFGIVQDVFLLGATLSMSTRMWCKTRSVCVAALRQRVRAQRPSRCSTTLFRACSGGVGTVAGLHPVETVPGPEKLGFHVFADYLDEPVEPDFDGDRIVEREEQSAGAAAVDVEAAERDLHVRKAANDTDDGRDRDFGGRLATAAIGLSGATTSQGDGAGAGEGEGEVSIHAGFDFAALKEVLGTAELRVPEPNPLEPPYIPPPTNRSVSAPLPLSEPEPPHPAYTYPAPAPASVSTRPRPPSPDLVASFSSSLSVNDAPARGYDSGSDNTETEDETPPLRPRRLRTRGRPRRTSRHILPALPNSFSPPSASISVGLSFGGADGAITYYAFASPSAADSWTIPDDVGRRKKREVFGATSNQDVREVELRKELKELEKSKRIRPGVDAEAVGEEAYQAASQV
ncbi:hypothetical protein MKEN_00274900 [Mycena kentingensis (nom. inval.)]|nr:hypothetical protein MKEN_00274900 [Mycena kentingensis (nom. inval.)]